VKYVPGKIAGRLYFQYTAVDVASRWRHLEIYDEQTNHRSICFLKEVMRRFDYPIAAIKTDNHATFTKGFEWNIGCFSIEIVKVFLVLPALLFYLYFIIGIFIHFVLTLIILYCFDY
jgi:hypothetical protein